MRKFSQRMLTSLIGIAICLVCILLSSLPWMKPLFNALVALLVALSMKEYFRLARAAGCRPRENLAIVGAVAYILALSTGSVATAACAAALAAASLPISFLIEGKNPLLNSAVSLFGLIYLALPLGCAFSINYFYPDFQGRFWLLYLLAVTKVSDTGAYFTGKLAGFRLLAPEVSPNKTVEGAFGGLLSALATSLILPPFFKLALSPLQRLALGLILFLLATAGDLVESLLKREAKVKDSGRIPGLGGMLDIVDSLIFTLPFMYLYLLAYGE